MSSPNLRVLRTLVIEHGRKVHHAAIEQLADEIDRLRATNEDQARRMAAAQAVIQQSAEATGAASGLLREIAKSLSSSADGLQRRDDGAPSESRN